MDETNQVIDAFTDAFNRYDLVTAQQLVAPNVRFVFDAGTPAADDLSLDEFLAQAQARGAQVRTSNRTSVDDETVRLDGELTGPGVPALPHPFIQHVTVQVRYGRIASFVGETDPQTLADLAVAQVSGAAAAAAQALAAQAAADAANAAQHMTGSSDDPLSAAKG